MFEMCCIQILSDGSLDARNGHYGLGKIGNLSPSSDDGQQQRRRLSTVGIRIVSPAQDPSVRDVLRKPVSRCCLHGLTNALSFPDVGSSPSSSAHDAGILPTIALYNSGAGVGSWEDTMTVADETKCRCRMESS